MTHTMQDEDSEGRRAFFKTVGRTLVLGLTGAGVAAMIQQGKIDVCINELSPCSKCIVLAKGCELPKAVEHRRMEADAKPS
jgi:hypothetical protein